MLSQNFSSERFITAQLGEFRELLSNEEYGPVHRLWIDHPWQTCHNYSKGAPGPPGNPRFTACPPVDARGKAPFPLAQIAFDKLVAELSPETIMGGSEYWNGPTNAQYPNWYYCNRSVDDIPGSGCVGHHTPPGECSDEHSQFGDSFRPIEITGSAIGGWFGAKEKKERRNASEIWQMWVSAAASFAPSAEASRSCLPRRWTVWALELA